MSLECFKIADWLEIGYKRRETKKAASGGAAFDITCKNKVKEVLPYAASVVKGASIALHSKATSSFKLFPL